MSVNSQFYEWAPAKLNMFLHITGQRASGYHELSSLFVFAGVADKLTYKKSADLSLMLKGPYAATLKEEPGNLVLTAAENLAQAAGIQPKGTITLQKNLPVSSGIGGGSADAAATLRLLNRMWGLGLSLKKLENLALSIGADVPACVRSRAMNVSGVGEILENAPKLPQCWFVLVNPQIPLSTPDVFNARAGQPFGKSAPLARKPKNLRGFVQSLRFRGNDLAAPAAGLVPEIATVLSVLTQRKNAKLARMSGSGATCFAIYDDALKAHRAAAEIWQANPSWWVTAAPLVNSLPDIDKFA